MRRFLLVLLLISSLKAFSQTTDTTFYSVVNLKNVIGENKVWKTAPQVYNYYYYFNDRGRGSINNDRVIVDDHFKVLSITSNGVDYFKVPYHSSFELLNDSLITEYNSIRTAAPDSGQFNVYSGTPAGIELIIAAMRMAPGNKVFGMNGDTIRIEHMMDYQLNVNNTSVYLHLCDINYGPGSSPAYIWLDNDYHFFGEVSGWTQVIKKGFESWTDTLHALQEIQAIPFYRNIFIQLSDTLPDKFAIKNILLFDAVNAKTIKHQTVLVDNGIIKSVGKSSNIKIPEEYTVIDGKGKTLSPGLWDTHAHYGKDDGINYLCGGITHVRDMGNMQDIVQMQANIRSHNLLGPDISYLSGFIDKNDAFHGPVGILANSKAEAVQAVDQYHHQGYDQIKIYSSIDTSWVRAMCAEAHKNKMRVAGHIPWHLTAAGAVMDGYDEITHMNMVMFNFYPDTIDTRNNRFKPIGRYANTIDLQSESVKKFIQLLQQHHTVVEPTMNVFEEMFRAKPGDTDPDYKPVEAWLPGYLLPYIKINAFVDDSSQIANYDASYTRMLQMLKLLYDNHITLLTGTDGGDQLGLQHELELFVEAGIPANEVLKMATYTPTQVLGSLSTYGSIEPGRVADFILIDGDPTKNISDIRRVFLVVTNHSLYYPKKLYAYSEWKYYY